VAQCVRLLGEDGSWPCRHSSKQCRCGDWAEGLGL